MSSLAETLSTGDAIGGLKKLFVGFDFKRASYDAVRQNAEETIEKWVKGIALQKHLSSKSIIIDVLRVLNAVPGTMTFIGGLIASFLEKNDILKKNFPNLVLGLAIFLKGGSRGLDLSLDELDSHSNGKGRKIPVTKSARSIGEWLLARNFTMPEEEEEDKESPSFLRLIPENKMDHFAGLYWAIMDACSFDDSNLPPDVARFESLDGTAYQLRDGIHQLTEKDAAGFIRVLQTVKGRELSSHEVYLHYCDQFAIKHDRKPNDAERHKIRNEQAFPGYGKWKRRFKRTHGRHPNKQERREERKRLMVKIKISAVERVRRKPLYYGRKVFPLILASTKPHVGSVALDTLDRSVNLASWKKWIKKEFRKATSRDKNGQITGINLKQVADLIPKFNNFSRLITMATATLPIMGIATAIFTLWATQAARSAAGDIGALMALLIFPVLFALYGFGLNKLTNSKIHSS